MSNPMTTHGSPSWLGHNGPDPIAARKYYEDVLSWSIVEMPMQDGSTYAAIMVGEAPIGGFATEPQKDAFWLSYITVDDVDKRYKLAIENGGSAVSEPMDVPGVGRIGIIRDPFGATLAFYKAEDMPA